MNAGQFRNGLVLAPASAQLLSELIMGERPFIDPKPTVLHWTRGANECTEPQSLELVTKVLNGHDEFICCVFFPV